MGVKIFPGPNRVVRVAVRRLFQAVRLAILVLVRLVGMVALRSLVQRSVVAVDPVIIMESQKLEKPVIMEPTTAFVLLSVVCLVL
jgi:hypothetical protein